MAREHQQPHAARVVVPDPKLKRGPWIEVRLAITERARDLIDLEERIEQAWREIDFEFLDTDVEDL